MKILVCYITAFDQRRFSPQLTPFLAQSLQSFPSVQVTNLPSNELLPTILTGVYPGEHGVWGVRLKDQANGHARRWSDMLPDLLTTSVQCIRHALNGSCDLSAIPPWRRDRLQITRTKYVRRQRPHDVLAAINGKPSLLGVLGDEHSRYLFRTPTNLLRDVLPDVGNGNYTLEWLELYSLNRVDQWHGDAAVLRYYTRTDEFIRTLQHKCEANGVTLIVFNDHGHDPVVGHINLRRELRKLGLGRDEYTYFLELGTVRFWFHSDAAREKISALLKSLPHANVFTAAQLAQFHLAFADEQYGELVAILDPGYIFYPHDFHHPLANLYLGLTDWKQWPRLFDARQRRNCGYLPDSACEKGFMLLLDDRYRAAPGPIELIDIAPSLLAMLGQSPPASMKGRTVFATTS